jgi:hypothetical protein
MLKEYCMTDKDKTCDVCGHSEFYAGVASSGLGPMSQAYCSLCLGMGAESRLMVEATIESCNGIENVAAYLSYYDREKDSYIDIKTNEIVPITASTGKKFDKRADFIEYHNKLLRVCSCPTQNCGKTVDITDWDGTDPMICMCCCEQFEWNDFDKSTIKWIEKTWGKDES